ncbi:hypothetical protein [Capnocytophaga cynodegmi]|uniref:Uncharacterized protein n=1 Tax=Capnocytophaga cynodegmi TaxID=28189 RepID=A0A0B7HNK1_9FLAO|nr:hypothetical protein [Capnocytophaga cynodegmi]ATA67692.1 hypothetical protein CGC48_03020 [Capnocytophaga cynodegmi]CEN34035.1 conserved hypothetical protein [Capnocytophaga cynodegmi]CEN37715.1 conserved hypothetical protein [Capnocytophaga cynodegmi]CEN39083.1 conserved hypothetical protein [Capnocytophaga cynodegmi]GIM55500.1 hypothetical protein CAPN005_21470 [Capnocytophaga cynodegmi]
MKKILQIALWAVGLFFCFMIYKSVTGPIEFNKIKTERYTAVIGKLKDIRDAQEAHRVVTGKYANSFDDLTKFIENEKFTITSQRDTSWTEYDKTFKIDVLKQGVVVDTLGYVSVKDSLFKNSDRYKNLRYVPFAENPKEEFVLKTASLDKNGYSASVFEVSVPKIKVLWGLDKNEVEKEVVKNSVEDVKGADIKVGSLEELSTNGNWPTSYDAKTARK